MLVKTSKRLWMPLIPTAVDTETTGVRVWQGDRPFLFSFTNVEGETRSLELPVDPYTRKVQEPRGKKREDFLRMSDWLEDSRVLKIFHNAKFDIRMCERGWDIHVPHELGQIGETMFMAHACNTLEPSFKLKKLAEKYLQYDNSDEKILHKRVVQARRIGKKRRYRLGPKVETDFWMPKVIWPKDNSCDAYATCDTDRTIRLFLFYSEVMQVEEVEHTYREEMELWPITYAMETVGVRCRKEIVEREIGKLQAARKKAKNILFEEAGRKFNIDSDNEIREIVYGKLKLPVLRRTDKSKQPAVNVTALYEHVQVPFVRALFEYRAADKGLSSFFYKYREAIPDVLSPGEYSLHPDFNQVGPVTGRYSCRNPNLQNVANALTTRSSEPIQARTPFGPRKGRIWLHGDYSQLEVRIFADVSDEVSMKEALTKGEDIHTFSANKIWGWEDNPRAIRAAIQALELQNDRPSSEEIATVWEAFGGGSRHIKWAQAERIADKWLKSFHYNIVEAEKSVKKKTSRAKAKMVVFLKVYGGGAAALADLMGSAKNDAQTVLNEYDSAFPRVKQYMQELTRQARLDGCIVNRYGRKLSINPDKAYRCVNYMVQGSAASLVKRSMVRSAAYLAKTNLDVNMLINVHDEIVFEFRLDHFYHYAVRQLKRIMEDHEGHFSVELPVDFEVVTERWDRKKKFELPLAA